MPAELINLHPSEIKSGKAEIIILIASQVFLVCLEITSPHPQLKIIDVINTIICNDV